jgi:5'-nucleotidase
VNLLVDLDGTIADWQGWFDKHVDDLYPQFSDVIPRKDAIRTWDMKAGHTLEVQEAITHIFNHEGFYADIPEIPGAIEALHEMKAQGHNVLIVTSPWLGNPSCLEDKKNWVKSHLGAEWLEDLVLTRDKTVVRGDYLYDDKPEIKGRYTPSWTQILIDQSYNHHITNLPRLTDWSDWYGVIKEHKMESILSMEY